MARGGSCSSASCHRRSSTRFSPGNPATAKCRASTRFTLPSRIAARARKHAAVVLLHQLCRALQIARTRVIAEPAPQPQHLILRRAGERGDIGEAPEKTAVIRNHRTYLGLLQHDFRDPDAVGLARALPRQVVAAVALVPGEQT